MTALSAKAPVRSQSKRDPLRWASGNVRAEIEREKRLAFAHYKEPHTSPVNGCPECYAYVRYFLWALASHWQPRLDPLRGLR